MTMQELLFDDGAIWFFGIAAIASLLFILTILMLFIGGDGGFDADTGDASDGAFKVLSFQGIVGFSMGWGWGGLAGFRNLELSWAQSALFGLVIGTAFLWILWLGFKAMHDLTGDGNIDPGDAIGAEVFNPLGGLKDIGQGAAPGIAEGGDFVDVDAEESHPYLSG